MGFSGTHRSPADRQTMEEEGGEEAALAMAKLQADIAGTLMAAVGEEGSAAAMVKLQSDIDEVEELVREV